MYSVLNEIFPIDFENGDGYHTLKAIDDAWFVAK